MASTKKFLKALQQPGDFSSLVTALSGRDFDRVNELIENQPELLKLHTASKKNIFHVIADAWLNSESKSWEPTIKNIVKSLGVDAVREMLAEKDFVGKEFPRKTPLDYLRSNSTFQQVFNDAFYAEINKEQIQQAEKQKAQEREAKRQEAIKKKRELQIEKEAKRKLKELKKQEQLEKQALDAKLYEQAAATAKKNADLSERKASATHALAAKQFLDSDPLTQINIELDRLKAIAHELPRYAHEEEQVESMKRLLASLMSEEGHQWPSVRVKMNVGGIQLSLSRIENSQLKLAAGEVMKEIMKVIAKEFPKAQPPTDEQPTARSSAGGPSLRGSRS